MEPFSEFLECYKRWAGWIGFDQAQIRKNTIWHQCTEMMNNEFMFRALFLAGKKVSGQPDYNTYLAANAPLYRHLLQGYLGFQYLAIRRLTDKGSRAPGKGVTSLWRLLSDMKDNEELITRKAFVCAVGLPYDFEALLEEERALLRSRMMKEKDGIIWGESGLGAKSAERHLMFDRLSRVVESDRKPDDRVAPEFWQECEILLEQPALKQIKNFVDKFLAHAADEHSQATLEEEDKLLSQSRIHAVQESLITLIHRLTLGFYGEHYAMIPVFSAGQILYNFSQPFAPEAIAREVYEELQAMIQKGYSSF